MEEKMRGMQYKIEQLEHGKKIVEGIHSVASPSYLVGSYGLEQISTREEETVQ
jgi:hypothetical protein